ncbi:hypothetical protein BH09ACT10_BH09ACT10_00430 [soil metagenome]
MTHQRGHRHLLLTHQFPPEGKGNSLFAPAAALLDDVTDLKRDSYVRLPGHPPFMQATRLAPRG